MGKILRQALLYPNSRIPASELPTLEQELIELGLYDSDLPIEPEYWKGSTQYHPMVHAYESRKKPHTVLKGRNCFQSVIRARAGDGTIKEVLPGEAFRTHPLIYLDC